MRKDVKLGFAIGGILLAVLIVYVLVVPGSDKTPPTQSKGSAPTSVIGDGARAGATNATGTGAAAPTTRSTAVTGASAAGGNRPDVFDPTPRNPAAPDNAVQAGAKTDPKWDKLLDGDIPISAAIANSTTVTGVTTHTPVGTSGNGTTGAVPTFDPTPISPTTQHAPSGGSITAAASRIHVVREGETLSSIAATAYGSANYFPYIQRANAGLDPSKLKVGQTINLPDAAEVKHGTLTSAASSSEPGAVNSANEYRVVEGDSLHKISVKLYGKSDRATKIYELNKAAIGADPAKLKLGAVLKLPEAPTIK